MRKNYCVEKLKKKEEEETIDPQMVNFSSKLGHAKPIQPHLIQNKNKKF